MAISHTCATCGYDLARTRALHDAALDLWIVRCPRCDTAVVRRRHPGITSWRRVLRFRAAIFHLVFQLGFGALILLVPFAASFTLPSAAGQLRVDHIHEIIRHPDVRVVDAGPLAIVGVGLSAFAGLAAGVWLRAGLPHWRPAVAWFAWFALLMLLVALPSILCELSASYESLMGREPHTCADFLRSRPIRAESALLVGVVAIGAIPLGSAWRRIRGRSRQLRWRRRLRRRRAARGRA
jgi:hypothetical protein